ncbi:MAG: tetratricopeptide repeat protein [Candidatus Micrarchaeota archaeon]
MDAYKRALETVDGKLDLQVHANAGEMALRLDRHDEAIDSLKTALSISTDVQLDIKIRGNLASALFGKGLMANNEKRYEEALKLFREALLYEPDDKDILKAIRRLETK